MNAGTLSLGNGTINSSLADTAAVIIGTDPTAVLHLNYSGTDTVASLTINGEVKPPGSIVGSSDPSNRITGSGTLTVTGVSPQTAFEDWATGSETFNGDANGDGIADGLAWFLGAANPSVNAQGKMPTPTNSGGFLNLSFQRVDPYAPAKLYVQFGNNLTGWTELEIPAASSPDLGGTGVQVDVVSGSPDQVTVQIPTSYESDSGALFARLRAAEN